MCCSTPKRRLQILGIESSHVFELLSLPFIHKAPFDRIIIAQAIVEGLEIITSDDTFKNYPVKIL
ncbi:MAG: PIN domain-containing protein [Saprospiraceae bacterium]|nr:PIN domain-containing protein [Saprospiraceae bacterium]